MSPGVRFTCVLMAVLFFAAVGGSIFGWGLPDEASARAKSVRQGSLRSRTFVGGGPSFGK
jgi:hypothetical protein